MIYSKFFYFSAIKNTTRTKFLIYLQRFMGGIEPNVAFFFVTKVVMTYP